MGSSSSSEPSTADLPAENPLVYCRTAFAANCISFAVNLPETSLAFPSFRSISALTDLLNAGAEFRSLSLYSFYDPHEPRGQPEAFANALRADGTLENLKCEGKMSDSAALMLAAVLGQDVVPVEVTVLSTGMTMAADRARLLMSALAGSQSLRSVTLETDGFMGDPTVILPLLRGRPGLRRLAYVQKTFPEAANTEIENLVASTSGLEVLSLTLCNASPAQTQSFTASLAASLDRAGKLEELSVRESRLGDLGAGVLCKGIAKNRSLRRLSLRGNMITSEGAKSIAEYAILARKRGLMSLDLTGNRIGDLGAKSILAALVGSHCPISTLRLGLCELTAESGPFLADLLRFSDSLTSLDLCENCLGDTGVASILKSPSSLLELRLCVNEITSFGCKSLADWLGCVSGGSLRKLDLRANAIKTEGAIAVADAIERNQRLRLEQLDLSYNEIQESACDSLEKMIRRQGAAVKRLQLVGTRLGETGEKRLLAAAKWAGVSLTIKLD